MVTPATFKPLAPGVNWALGVIMFGMGLTLTLPDFGLIVKRPLPVLVGVVAQYLIMPSSAGPCATRSASPTRSPSASSSSAVPPAVRPRT